MNTLFNRSGLVRALLVIVVTLLAVTMFSCDLLSGVLGGGDDGSGDDGDGDDTTSLQADAFETNDTWQEAAVLSLDTEVSATIHENADVDFYEITTAHSSDTYDKVDFVLEAGSADLLFHFEVYSTSGEQLRTATANTPGQNFTYTLSCPGGTYLFRVSGWDSIMNWDNGSHGSYTARISNLDANDPYAPNHTMATAEPINFGTAYDGVLVSIYEEDWYQATNADSDRWDIFEMQITNVSDDLAAGYYIYDDAGGEIYVDDSALSGYTEGENQFYSFASKSPSFSVGIVGWNNVMHGPHGSSGSYTLTFVDQNANDSFEPDDTIGEAQEVTSYPAPLSGTVVFDAANDNGGDYEWFKVDIADGTRIDWEADPTAANTELHFNVYDSNQAYLGQQDGGDGETITGWMSNDTGTASHFYIELGAFVGDNGDYTMTFTESAL